MLVYYYWLLTKVSLNVFPLDFSTYRDNLLFIPFSCQKWMHCYTCFLILFVNVRLEIYRLSCTRRISSFHSPCTSKCLSWWMIIINLSYKALWITSFFCSPSRFDYSDSSCVLPWRSMDKIIEESPWSEGISSYSYLVLSLILPTHEWLDTQGPL